MSRSGSTWRGPGLPVIPAAPSGIVYGIGGTSDSTSLNQANGALSLNAVLSGSSTTVSSASGAVVLTMALSGSSVTASSASGAIADIPGAGGAPPVPYTISASNVISNLTSQTFPVSTASAVGDSIVVFIQDNGTAINSLIDSQGNTYILASKIVTSPRTSIYYCLNATPLTTSDTFTVGFTAAGFGASLIARGCASVTSFDVAPAFTTATSTAPSIASGALAQVNEWVIGSIANASAGGQPSALTGGFVLVSAQHPGGLHWLTVADQIVSSNASVVMGGTIVNSLWSAGVVSFVVTVSVGGTVYPVAGSSSGASSASGTLGMTEMAAGTSAALSVASGTVTQVGIVSGSSSTVSSASGVISGTGFTSGSSVAASAATGVIVRVNAVSGTSATGSSGNGVLGLNEIVAGSSSALSSANGAVVKASPWYMTNTIYIHQMYGIDPTATSKFFNTPVAFGISTNPAATGIQDGFTCTPVLKYTSYAQFQSDIAAGNVINAAFTWIMYDNEYWSGSGSTPVAEYNDPWTYMANFVSLAHAHGFKVICTPSRDLGLAPGTVNPRVPSTEPLDNWYLRTNIPGAAATAGAEIVHIQSQADTVPTATFTSFFNSARSQAITGGAGPASVSAGVSTTYGTQYDMAAAAQSVVPPTAGFWLNVTSAPADLSEGVQFLELMGGYLAGSSAVSSAAAGTITQIAVLSGSSSTPSTASGTLGRFTPLAGSSASVSSAGGAVTISVGAIVYGVAGSAAGTSFATGTLGLAAAASGTAAATAAATGAVTAALAVNGLCVPLIVAGGALSLTAAAAGSAVTGSAAAGAVVQTLALSGSSVATSVASGALGRFTPLSGAAAAASAASGAITISTGPVTYAIAGSSAGLSVASGAIVSALRVAGASVAASSASGTIGRVASLAGSSVTASSATGSVVIGAITYSVAGSSAAVSAAFGSISGAGMLTGVSMTASVGSGTVTVRLAAAGTAAAVSSASGVVGGAAVLSGISITVSTASGWTTVLYGVSGLSVTASYATGNIVPPFTAGLLPPEITGIVIVEPGPTALVSVDSADALVLVSSIVANASVAEAAGTVFVSNSVQAEVT